MIAKKIFERLCLVPVCLFLFQYWANMSLEEGTGTWPDYLVNRDDQKNEGPFGEKIVRKSRNSCRVNGRSCGCL